MDIESHRKILERAIAVAGARWAEKERERLLRGNDDEDVHVVPLLGWRLRSVGFTHTYKPGSRFGELGTPSALIVGRGYYREARSAWPSDRGRVAYLLGRLSHLLVDTAVPARSRGVWHFNGDPFEDWVESRAGEISSVLPAQLPSAPSSDALFESLAGLSAAFPADTTRTPWGALLLAAGRGVRLTPDAIERQARVLLPAAVAHVAALLRGAESW